MVQWIASRKSSMSIQLGISKVILANSTDFGGSLPIFKAIYRLPPGGVNATNYKSTAFASLNVGKYEKSFATS